MSQAFTISETLRHQTENVKGSRFIATIAPVQTDDQARAFIKEIASTMPDASHHCTAWRIASPAIERCDDDGEPSGSAGRPILSHITGRDLVNTVAVVTRYFGGVKLGVGGLVRAYGSAAGEALDLITLTPYEPTVSVTVRAEYGDAANVEHVVAGNAGTIDNTIYDDAVRFTITIAERRIAELGDSIADATSGRAQFDEPQ